MLQGGKWGIENCQETLRAWHQLINMILVTINNFTALSMKAKVKAMYKARDSQKLLVPDVEDTKWEKAKEWMAIAVTYWVVDT